MYDIISQSTLDTGLQLPEDALGHKETAHAIIHKAVHLPPGAVIAVQGSWGRGKTDVLARVAQSVRAPKEHGLAVDIVCEALWVNPWQYGTPDLLTPLVIALLERMPPERRSGDKALRKAAESILRAGFNFGMKAAGLVSPIFGAGVDAVDKLMGGLFEALGQQKGAEPPDLDPVAKMGERFKELVEALMSAKQMAAGARVLVCVDDLDRCLPDRQVAMLEAIRFLTSAGAPATFLIALDPTLARQALVTHYKTVEFDPDRYLDKMFHLRVNLPAAAPRVKELVKKHLERKVRVNGEELPLGTLLDATLGREAQKHLIAAAPLTLGNAALGNPRSVRRIMDRLYLLGCTAERNGKLSIEGEEGARLLLAWLGIAERWPEVRHALQDGGRDDFERRLGHLMRRHRGATTSLNAAVMDLLPGPDSAPELRDTLRVLGDEKKAAAVLLAIDDALVRAGL